MCLFLLWQVRSKIGRVSGDLMSLERNVHGTYNSTLYLAPALLGHTCSKLAQCQGPLGTIEAYNGEHFQMIQLESALPSRTACIRVEAHCQGLAFGASCGGVLTRDSGWILPPLSDSPSFGWGWAGVCRDPFLIHMMRHRPYRLSHRSGFLFRCQDISQH